MSTIGDALSTFAGPAGVGALCALGVFLFLDGRAPDLFPTFEQYTKTSSWSVVAAVPVLAISYVLGLSMMIASERVLTTLGGPTRSTEASDIARIVGAALKSESLASQLYVEALRNRAVLAGGALALVVLAFGAFSEIRNLPNLRSVILAAALATLLLAGLASYLAVREGHRAHTIATAVEQSGPKPQP